MTPYIKITRIQIWTKCLLRANIKILNELNKSGKEFIESESNILIDFSSQNQNK